jgi:predicted ATP-grasp superfamily ATP-dependent carboligase
VSESVLNLLIPEQQARNVLAVIRALGRAGHRITLAPPMKEPESHRRARFISRFVADQVPITSPHTDSERFVQDLIKILEAHSFDVLMPFTHATVLPVSYHRAELIHYAGIPIAEYEILRLAHDKLETVKLAQRLGVPTPVTFHPKDRAGLLALESRGPFPCLVKARQGCGVGSTIRFATNFDELLEGYEVISGQPSNPPINDYSAPIIQEYVPGQLYDANFLYAEGRPRAALTQERVVTYPIQGGPGAVNETIIDPVLRDCGQRLLDALHWHGLAQVEFRLDPRDDTYKLMEINPKFWGTLPLSIVAGVDFATLACEMALGNDIGETFDYRVNMRYRWLFPSELYALTQDPSGPKLRQFLNRFGHRATHYDWDLGDPLPDLLRAIATVRTILFRRNGLLPAREGLNALALQRAPARQTEPLA